jgi:hypothetical protein
VAPPGGDPAASILMGHTHNLCGAVVNRVVILFTKDHTKALYYGLVILDARERNVAERGTVASV